MKILYVGFGGFIGAIARYFISGIVHKFWDQSLFPIGTLSVNLLGCVLIGFLSGLAISRQLFSPEARLFVLVGFLGSLTTFSTFAYETFALSLDAGFSKALLNIGLQILFGLLAVWIGYDVAKLF